MDKDFVEACKAMAIARGDRLQFISVSYLDNLKEELINFREKEELNNYQKWILDDMYQMEMPKADFQIKSILLLAVYHPFATYVELEFGVKTYSTRNPAHTDFLKAESYVRAFLDEKGFHMLELKDLPLKRMAVQSGLAVYGRNNITYVEGLGSSISYIAFATDVECLDNEWKSVSNAELCRECNICVNGCPTGAICKERFLIDNQKCLTYMNQKGGEFPDWLSDDVHHTLYDCLRCQENCPMNKDVVKDCIGPVSFSEEEVTLLLNRSDKKVYTQDFLSRAEQVGMFDCEEGLVRNIRAIIEQQDKKSK